MTFKALPSSQHQHCTDEAQKAVKSLQLTRLLVECLPEDFLHQAFVDLGEIVLIVIYLVFFLLPVYSFIFWWCFPLSPFGVEPPALPCGLA